MTGAVLNRGGGQDPASSPVFVLSPARSYSTVTTALLAGHPMIYGFPELLLFTAPTVGEQLDTRRYAFNRRQRFADDLVSGVYRTVAEVHEHDQSEPAIGRAAKWLRDRSAWTTAELMRYLLDQVRPRTGLEKSPGTVSSDEAVTACLTAFPGARFIHLTRHPVDTQKSMQKHLRRMSVQPLDDKRVVASCASAWYLGHQRALRALAQLPQSRWVRLRAEDILREPRVWLPRVLSWLGLACDDGILSRMLRTEDWRFSHTEDSRRLFGGDPGFFAAPALRPVPAPGPVCFDPGWGLPDEMCRRMTVLAQDLGY